MTCGVCFPVLCLTSHSRTCDSTRSLSSSCRHRIPPLLLCRTFRALSSLLSRHFRPNCLPTTADTVAAAPVTSGITRAARAPSQQQQQQEERRRAVAAAASVDDGSCVTRRHHQPPPPAVGQQPISSHTSTTITSSRSSRCPVTTTNSMSGCCRRRQQRHQRQCLSLTSLLQST